MINNISWTSYWYALFLLLVIYYAFVLWYYYRKYLFQLISNKFGKRKFQVATTITSPSGILDGAKKNGHEFQPISHSTVTQSQEQPSCEISAMYQALSDEIRAYLQQASTADADNEELLISIQQILRKYPAIKNSAFQQSIDFLIVFELKNKCSTYLSIEEVSSLWES